MDPVKIRAWVIIIVVLSAIVLFWWKNRLISHAEFVQKLNDYFKGRTPLDDEDFYIQYFRKQGIPREIPVRVRQIFSDKFDADFSRIRNTDEFGEDMKFIWGFDSMIDVEIVMEIEKEFGIKIPDEEAEKLTSIQKIVDSVCNHKKNAQPEHRAYRDNAR
jgi:acyl carrier protein